MASRDVIFRFIGIDAGAGREFDKMAGKARGAHKAMGALALGVVGAGVTIAAESIKMAGDFQSAVMHLQTDAGESAKNMKMVSDGIIKVSNAVGTSTQELTKGMYFIESAGFHGASALKVLQSAAEGAKVGGANMETVANALTSALNAYSLKGSDSVSVTNQLIAAVSHGKMRMEDLAGSIGKVLPVAAAAHVSLQQVLGAMATMTSQGVDAANAATYLRQIIGQLEAPSAKARTEMERLGLSALDVQQTLGKKGLTSALDLLYAAVAKKMGPAGTVLVDKLQSAAKATKNYDKVTNSTAKTATGWVKSQTETKKVGDKVTTTVTKLVDVHGKLHKETKTSTALQKDFLQVIADLPPEQQTAVQAIETMVGGVKTMQAALMLGGDHAKTFSDNVKGITAASKDTKNGVKDWNVIQDTFNQKMDVARTNVHNLMLVIGNDLLPVASQMADWFNKKGVPALQNFFGWVSKHKDTIKPLAKELGEVALALKAISLFKGASAAFLGLFGKNIGGLGAATGFAGAAKGVTPVYVTNKGFGAPGGGGSSGPTAVGKNTAKAAERDAATASKAIGPAAIIGGLTLPLTVTYAAATSDSAPKVPGVSDRNAGAFGRALIPILRAIAGRNPKSDLSGVYRGPIDDPHGQKVDATQAVRYIEQYGTPAQIKALDDLAAKYPQVKKAMADYGSQQQSLYTLLGMTNGALGTQVSKVQDLSRAIAALPTQKNIVLTVTDSRGNDTAVRNAGQRGGRRVAMAYGGPVTGGIAGQDSVPALLMPGEFVVRADGSNIDAADRRYRRSRMHPFDINAIGDAVARGVGDAMSRVVTSNMDRRLGVAAVGSFT